MLVRWYHPDLKVSFSLGLRRLVPYSCHPFHKGRLLFMHNGMVGGFTRVRRRLMASLSADSFAFAVEKGASDSALLFALFLDRVPDVTQAMPADAMREAVGRTRPSPDLP